MTSEESFAIYETLKKTKLPKGGSYLERQQIREKELAEAIKNLVPTEGLGCTIILFSDRLAATVTKVISPTKIEVRKNDTECLDYYNGKYTVLPELTGSPKIFTKRKNGMWVEQGQAINGGVKLALHYQRHYIDPHF